MISFRLNRNSIRQKRRNRNEISLNISTEISVFNLHLKGIFLITQTLKMNNKPLEQELITPRTILNAVSIKELWSKTYNTEGKPDWSHILPYYDDNIYFKDSIQAIHGIEEFRAMTERLTNRSNDLKMNIVHAVMQERIIFIELEMTIKYKKNPSSVL